MFISKYDKFILSYGKKIITNCTIDNENMFIVTLNVTKLHLKLLQVKVTQICFKLQQLFQSATFTWSTTIMVTPKQCVKSATVRKVSRYGVFSSPYFPVFRPEKTPYLDTFYTVNV